MDAEPFHVVDLVSEVGKKQVGSVDQLTRGSKSSTSPDGSVALSLMSKSSRRLTENCPGAVPPTRKALRLPSASRPRSEKPIKAPPSLPLRGANVSASRPLFEGRCETPGGAEAD